MHYTERLSHGNLKSSNCLVDSRFVLKITDFGLDELRTLYLSKIEITKPMKASLLWKPPEVLRNIKLEPGLVSLNSNIILRDKPFAAKCKADIYSLGIIMYEIVGRRGPWGDLLDSNEVISERSYFTGNTIAKIKISNPFVEMLKQSSKEDIKLETDEHSSAEQKKESLKVSPVNINLIISKLNIIEYYTMANYSNYRKDIDLDAKQMTGFNPIDFSEGTSKEKPRLESPETKKATKSTSERLKVDEIIERVKQSKKKPHFRPETAMLADCPSNLLRCILACWNEQPESRPTMRLINKHLRKFCAGL